MLAVEFDIEYDNGFRETVEVPAGVEFKVPFAGKVVAVRAGEMGCEKNMWPTP